MRKVLVFQLARFGDIVQTKRLILSLAACENTQVHLCLDSSLSGLARLLYPSAVIHDLPVHKSEADPVPVFLRCRETFALLRDIDFSEVYVLNFSPMAFACASLFRPEALRGYSRVKGQDLRGKFPLIAFNLMHDRRFAALNLVDMWANFHHSPVAPEKVNPIPKAAGHNRIGVVMAGRESRRSLPPQVLSLCLQAIFRARNGPELVCIGSKSEKPLVRRLLRELPSSMVQKVEDLTGQTRLTDLPEILQSLDMLVTPDTGAMHLAAHLGVPVQAFFLSSAWCHETGPYGFGHKVWQAIQPCSPCLESDPCPKDIACLTPFSQPAFLAHLSGKHNGGWPEGLLGCISMLDDLGVTYKCVDGDDPYAGARSELRGGLLEYLGQAPASASHPFMSQELADFLYTERDWMLPESWRHVPFIR